MEQIANLSTCIHTGVLEDLHPPPNGRGREPDMLGELTGRQRCIRL